MSGKSNEQLPRPKRPYRPNRDTRRPDGVCNFETIRQSSAEDGARTTLMCLAVEQFPGLFDVEALGLAAKLQEGAETLDPHPTLASSLYYRDPRIRWRGEMWRQAEGPSLQPAMVATLRPTSMWAPHDEVMRFNPRRVMRRLESDFFRAGLTKLKGWLLAGLHAEFDVNQNSHNLGHKYGAGLQWCDEQAWTTKRESHYISVS